MQNFLSSLVITLREGIEAALAIGIILLYLRKTGRSALSAAVWWGVACALATSVIGAYVLQRIAVNQEILEGILMFVAAIFVTTMIIWMWKSARGLKKEIEAKVEEIAAKETEGRGAWLALFMFTFLMIVREGMETVIFLSAVNVSSQAIISFSGGIIGLLLAVVFGIFFVRGSIRIDLGRFFKITGIVLLIFVIQLIIGGFHELSEGGLIDIGPRAMALIGPIVKNNALFLIGILLIPVLMLIIPARSKELPADTKSRADQRLALASERKQRMWRIGAAILAICVVVFITFDYVYGQNRTLSTPTEIEAVNGEIRIPLNTVSDGNLHRFILKGHSVRFIVMRTGDKIATALDACEICGSQGYVQGGSSIICLNCSADINPATIGDSGGCNPIHLSSINQSGTVVIPVNNLLQEEHRFESSSHQHK
ncbi:Fe-S-containing protein [bacterium]|nr:Fe-S-containing protein [bacterium]